MADISVIVDYSSVKAANREIEKTGSSAQKSAKVFEAAFKSAEIQTKKNLKSVRDQISFSKRMEAQKVKEAKAFAQAARNQANEEERLRSKFVAGHSAMNIYSRELDELARARKLDIISSQQQSAAVESLNKDFKAGTGIFANYANGVMKGANRMGVAMQQTGYQVGDFLVQVQSGTNPMVAFGQQATQLVGVLYLLPQATLAAKVGFMGLQVSMGAVVAVVSILIPLATAIGAYFLRAGEDAKEAASGVKTFEDRLKSARDEVISMKESLDLLNSGYENQTIKTFADRVDAAQKKLTAARAKIDEAIAPALETAIKQSEALVSAYTPEVLEEFAEKLKLLAAPELRGAVSEAVRELAEARELLRQEEQRQRDSSVKKQLSEARAIIQAQEAAAEEDYQKRLARTRVIMGRMVAERRAEAAAEAEEDRLENIKTLAKAEISLFKDNDAYEKEQIKLNKDAQVAAIALRRAAGEAYFRQESDIQDQILQVTVDRIMAEHEARIKAQKAAVESRRAAGIAYAKEQQRLEDDIHQVRVNRILEEHKAKVKAETDAVNLRRKAGLKYAREQQQLEEDIHQVRVDNILNEAALREATISAARAKFRAGAGQFGEASQDVAAQRLAELRKAYADSLKPAKPAKESDLEKLQKQLDLEDALLGKTEARQRVLQALGIKFVENNPKTVAGLEAQITANENLLRIEEERKRMNDLVTDSMEDGLMAMADGTKTVSEAFRSMAADIISELYRILVVQQIVNAAKSAMGFGFFADGGAFSGGSQIQAYADGGIVGSPTTFPMAGGKTGLMGEAGPEAIMPLKRGANGKLGVQMEGGGGDNVVINQSFNFQANGDDSVKKIIAQAAPQIANMTKKSMLDDRRRGGQMKATFG